MNAHEFVSAVAKYVDGETGMAFGNALTKNHARMLKKVIPDSRITVALEKTLWRIAPLDIDRWLPTAEMKSAKHVAKILVDAACMATSEVLPNKEHWGNCDGHASALIKTLHVFVQELCGRPTKKEREEDSLRSQKNKLQRLQNVFLAEREIVLQFANWGQLLSDPVVLMAVADSIRDLERDEERLDRLKEIHHVLTKREERPTKEEILEVLRMITTPPAGKA